MKLARLVPVIGVAVALLYSPTLADESTPSPDARALIERQLDALAHDDAAGAYALAAPGIKAMFPDADIFLKMVRSQYTPVYHHRSVEFGPAQGDSDSIAQGVTFVDDDGQVWKALYKIARQPDGSWLITGCSLIKSDDKAA